MFLLALMANRCGSTDQTGHSADSVAAIDWCPDVAAPDLEDRWTLADVAPGGDLFYVAESQGVIYATSTMNGMYRTLNGTSWDKRFTEVTHVQSQLAVSPDDSDVLAYGTNQLVWSLDGGFTVEPSGWPQLGDAFVRGVAWTTHGVLTVLDSGDVYRVARGEEPVQLGHIDAPAPPPHGGESNKWDLSWTWWFLAETDSSLLAAHHDDGVYRSVDGGASWSRTLDQDIELTTFGVDGDVAWAAAGTALWVSTDGGETWSQELDEGLTLEAVARADDGAWILATESLLYRHDGTLQGADDLPGVHNLRYVTRTGDGTLVAVHRDGSYLSDDGGVSWRAVVDGLEVDDLGPLLAHPDCPSVVWVGTQCERGLFASVDGWGEGLAYVDEYLHYVMVARIRDRDLWVTTDDALKRSQDLGLTWETIAPEAINVHAHGLALHPTDPDVVLVGTVGSAPQDDGDTTGRILRTDDGGATWSEAAGVPQNEASIHALHFVDEDVVLAGTFIGGDYVHQSGGPGIGMLRSTDAGESWTLLEGSPASVPIFDQCGDRVYAASDEGLLSSDDAGATWQTSTSSGEVFLSVTCRGELVLAIDQRGVWRSDDAGASWSDWSDGLSPDMWRPRQMPQVDISADGSLAYVAIPGEGLLRRPL